MISFVSLLILIWSFCVDNTGAVQNEADLQYAYTQAIDIAEQTPRTESGSPIDYDFTIGRATNYAYNQNGACGFGDINADESLGNPLHILAIPDCSPIFPGSCGVCFEVKCRNAIIEDDSGTQLDRTSACYDETASVVLRNSDACPSYYPANQASNSRWCSCANLAHVRSLIVLSKALVMKSKYAKLLLQFDISTEAFVQLADQSWGVIGTNWRRVTCDYTPENPAPVKTTQTFASPPPDPSKDQHRTFADWTSYIGSWVKVEDYQALNPSQVNPPNIYSSLTNGLLNGWIEYQQMTLDAVNGSSPEPPPPVTTGRGGQGEPLCRWAGRGQGIGLTSTSGFTAANSTLVQFWVYAGNFTTSDVLVNIGSSNDTSILCNYANTRDFSAAAENSEWLTYSISIASLQNQTCGSTSRVFNGCGGHDPSLFDSLYFINPLPISQWICLDDLQWN